MTGGNFIVGIWKEMNCFSGTCRLYHFLNFIIFYFSLVECPVKFVVVVVVSSDAERLFQFIFGGPTRALCQLPEMDII